MFLKSSENAKEIKSGFYKIDNSTTWDELKKFTEEASKHNNLHGLAQCMFKQYDKCKAYWSQFEFDSSSYSGKGTITLNTPSFAEDGMSCNFLNCLKSYAAILNKLLNTELDNDFFEDFHKRNSCNEACEINSFFNLVHYISNNQTRLNTGFNDVFTMANAHNYSVQENDNNENIYQKTRCVIHLS